MSMTMTVGINNDAEMIRTTHMTSRGGRCDELSKEDVMLGRVRVW